MIKRIKRIVLIFCLGLGFCDCYYNSCKAQWFPVNQDTTFFNTEIFFLNEDTGFVVGVSLFTSLYEGVISRTLNGGLTWDTTATGFANLTIHFPSYNAGYTGGHNGTVYKTTDIGDTWNEVGDSGWPSDYSNIYFLNNDTGFTTHWWQQIFRTYDGGFTWLPDTDLTGYTPYPGVGSIQFLNDSVGIIASGEFGTYSRTLNGGNSWQTGHIDSNMNVISIYMRNQNIGYAVGYDGKYSRTFDGGQTWTTPILLSQYHLNDIAFFTDSVGYIVGGEGSFPFINSYIGIILKTIDGGNSWAVEDSSYDEWLTSIFAVNSTTGYAAGWKGRILKITNGNSIGIHENNSLSNTINIFPNPTTGTIQLTINTKHNALLKCEIINMMGEKVFETTLPAPNSRLTTNLDVSFLAKGIYLVRVWNGEGFENRKLVIE